MPPVSSVLDVLGNFLVIPSCNQRPLSVYWATGKICNFHTFFLATCNKLQRHSKVQITTDVKFLTLWYLFIFCAFEMWGLHQLERPSSAVKVVTMQLVLFSEKLRGSMGFQAVWYCWYLLLLFTWAKSISKSSMSSPLLQWNLTQGQSVSGRYCQLHKYLSEWITGRLEHLHQMCSNRKRKCPMEYTNYPTMQRRELLYTEISTCPERYWHVLLALTLNMSIECNTEKLKIYWNYSILLREILPCHNKISNCPLMNGGYPHDWL